MTVRIHAHTAATLAATLALSTAGLCLAQTASSSGSAQNPGLRMTAYNLPSQPLADALKAIGAQDNINVLISPDLVDGKTAPALKAQLTFNDAVVELLRGTGLTYKFLSDKTIVLAAEGSKTSAASPGVRSSSMSEGEDGMLRIGQVDETTGGSATTQSPQSSPASEGRSGKVEEILVTAQRREEKLQDVPISITVLSGAELDQSRIEGLTETLRRIPGMAAPIGALGTPNISIRGVASPSLAGAGSAPVAYYLDSTPYGFVRNALAPNVDLYDLDRIEVLRGPQGTLFGANAQSGVVRVLTRDPTLSEFEAKSRASISSTDDGGTNYRGDVAVNVPIGDKLAARAVVGYQNRSGWIDKPGNPNADDAGISNARLKVKAQPTEKLSVVGSAWFMRYRADAQSIGNDNGQNIVAFDEPVHSDTNNFSLKANYDFSAFALTSATSYQEYQISSSLWLGVFGNPQIQTTTFSSDVFSQEVILNSQGDGPWKWSAGGSYRDVKDRRLAVVGVVTSTDFNDTSKSWAGFGELTRVLFDGKVEFTGGLRYFEDKQRLRENISSSGNPATPLVNVPSKFDALTPRLVLAVHPHQDLTVYASYAQGFRSGVSQNPQILPQVPGAPPARPDRLHNYEIGTKGNLFDGRVSFDGAVFFLDWKGVQQSLNEFYTTPFGRLELASILNGPSASGVGAEFGVTVEPVDRLELSGTFSWNDLRFDQNVFSGTALRFAKDTRLQNSPEYTAGASASYSFPFGEDLEGRLSTSANYTSVIENNTLTAAGVNRVGDDGASIFVVDASLSVNTAKRWSATMFVDNLTNDVDPSVRFIGIPGDTWNGLNTRPRTYGLQVEYKF